MKGEEIQKLVAELFHGTIPPNVTSAELLVTCRFVAAKARDKALSEAAERECVLCRDGFALHYGDWPLPFHRVSGRVRKCAARLVHALKAGSVEG